MEDWKEEQLVERVENGAVFIYPTDTCYGIGCSIRSTRGIDAVYRIKGRPEDKPVPVLLCKQHVESLVTPSAVEWKAIQRHWPGGLTLVMEVTEPPKWDERLLRENTMALRSPGLNLLNQFLSRVGPIVGTSANISGDPSPARLEDVHPQLLAEVDFVLGEHEAKGTPSTVAEWNPDSVSWTVHREGPVDPDRLPAPGQADSDQVSL